jgi:diaminopimelate decarboxylase
MPETKLASNQSLRPLTAHRNASGRLAVGGCDLSALAIQYGTPLYVLDEQSVRAAASAYKQALDTHYPPGGRVLYASKAHCTLALLAIVASEGLGIDAVSMGEAYTALKAGVPAESIVMQGNNKSVEEIEFALHEGIGRFNVDNLDELELLASITKRLGLTARLLLRVAPGIEAHTHEFIRTGQEDSKFGLDLKSGQLDSAIACLKENPQLHWLGLQAHIGSQIFDANAFERAADVMVECLAGLRTRHGLEAAELDLGGGLGIAYGSQDDPPAIEATVAAIAKAVLAASERHGLTPPQLVLEPGRSIVGPAGITLYTVGSRKVVPGVRTYVAIDGGMADNPRPITYGALYSAELANREAGEPELVTLAGRYCESGDLLIKDIFLPSPQCGDVVAVFATGAYTHAMASNYNRCARPAMVLVNEGASEIIVERETLDDLLRLDKLPGRLRGAS